MRMMVLTLFCLVLTVFGQNGFPYDKNTAHFIDATRELQAQVYRHADGNLEYATLASNPRYPSHIADFRQRAFAYALDQSAMVGSKRDSPTSSMSKWLAKAKGRVGAEGSRGQQWFYSFIHPTSELGREMRLPNNALASVLWKHQSGRFDLMHIDWIHRHDEIQWQLNRLKDLLPHTAI